MAVRWNEQRAAKAAEASEAENRGAQVARWAEERQVQEGARARKSEALRYSWQLLHPPARGGAGGAGGAAAPRPATGSSWRVHVSRVVAARGVASPRSEREVGAAYGAAPGAGAWGGLMCVRVTAQWSNESVATPLLPAAGGNAAWGGEELTLALPNEAAEAEAATATAGGGARGRTAIYGSQEDHRQRPRDAGAPSEAIALKVALWRRPPGGRSAWVQEVGAGPEDECVGTGEIRLSGASGNVKDLRLRGGGEAVAAGFAWRVSRGAAEEGWSTDSDDEAVVEEAVAAADHSAYYAQMGRGLRNLTQPVRLLEARYAGDEELEEDPFAVAEGQWRQQQRQLEQEAEVFARVDAARDPSGAGADAGADGGGGGADGGGGVADGGGGSLDSETRLRTARAQPATAQPARLSAYARAPANKSKSTARTQGSQMGVGNQVDQVRASGGSGAAGAALLRGRSTGGLATGRLAAAAEPSLLETKWTAQSVGEPGGAAFATVGAPRVPGSTPNRPSSATSKGVAPAHGVATVGRPMSAPLHRHMSAPSVRLMVQLDECARIKEAFERRGMTCPTAAIEGGLMVPEDRPRVLCEANLPRPGVHLADPWFVPRKAAKKKKGGKKKGGNKSPGRRLPGQPAKKA